MNLIRFYFKNISQNQINQLAELQNLITYWNSKINLISKNDVPEIEKKHILHSLSIAKFIDFNSNTLIADIGTGGGFPGLPLAIVFPNSEFILIDSIAKKIKVVDSIVKSLSLNNVKTLCERIENTDYKFEFIVNRAVTSFPALIKLTSNKISKNNKNFINNGLICLKGGCLHEELKDFKKAQIIPISQFFNEHFFETKKIVYYPC